MQSSLTVDDKVELLCAEADDPRPSPRVAIITAHPDDEVVGAGARFARLRDLLLLHLTDGAPRKLDNAKEAGCSTRQEYAAVRRNELDAALAVAGISPANARELGIPDQEASFNLVDLAREIERRLMEFKPEIVLTQPYEGGHPDHDAAAFAVHAACAMLEARGVLAPTVVEMTSFHNRDGEMATFEFLPFEGCDITTKILSGPARDLKRRMMGCYETQHHALLAFPVSVERFRPAPRYDFTAPPHDGRLFYEYFNWGTSGDQWRRLATEALGRLQQLM